MAENRNLHVQLTVDADTKKAQQEFQSLQQTLSKLATNSISINTDSMQQASKAAQELQIHLERAFNVNTGQLDLNKFSASLKASGKDISKYRQELEAIGPEGQKAFLQLAQSIATADAPLMKANTKLNEFLGTLKNTARWQISSSILHGFIGSLQTAYGYAQDLNKSLTNIQIVTQHDAAYMANFAKEANKAAQELSTTTTKYTNASLIFYQQGLSDEEVKKRTEVTIKMAQASGQAVEQVSSQLTAVWNNFYDGSKSLEYYADVMTALGAATASSSEEISNGLQKFAAIGETVGLSYEYAASALATITATTRESAETVGNALKTLFSRIQGLKLGKTLEDGIDLNKYSAALAAVGVNIKDANGELKDMDVILDELMSRWTELNREQQTALAQTVAGQRQYAQFMTLMNQGDFFKENLGVIAESEGTLEKQAAVYADSWEAARNRVRAALEEIYNDLIDDQFFIKVDNIIVKLLNGVHNVVEGLGGLKGILAMVGGFIVSDLASKAPQALSRIKEDLMIITGKAEELANKTRESLIQDLRKDTAHSDSEEYQLQIEKIQTIASLKNDLSQKQKQLTTAQQEEYNILIKAVEAEYDRQAALAKTVDLKKQSAAKSSNEAYDQIAGQTSDDKTLGIGQAQIDRLQNYAEQLGRIREVQSEATSLLKSFGDAGDSEFTKLRDKTVAWLDKLADTEKIKLSNPEMKQIYEDIKNNVKSIDELKDKLQTIAYDKSFKGLGESIEHTSMSVNDLDLEVAKLSQRLEAKGVDKTVIEKIIGDSKDFGEAQARLKQLEENIDNIKNKAPQIQGSFSQMFGKGTQLLMNFSSLLSSLTNSFAVFGDESATTSRKITTAIGLIIVSINLLKTAMNFSNSIAALSNMTGAFAGLGAHIALFAPAIMPLTVAVGALTAAFALNEAAAKRHREELEKNAETAKEAAEQYKTEWDEAKKQQEANEELIQTYQDCLTVFQETGTGRAALVEAAGAVVKALGLESEAVKIMRGDYQGLLTDILNVSDAKFEEAVKTAQAAKNTADAALIAEVQTSDSFVNTSGQLIDTSRWDWGIDQFRNFISDETNKSYGILYDNLKDIYDKYQGQLDDLINKQKQYLRDQNADLTEEEINSLVEGVDFQTVFTDLGMTEGNTLWDSLHEEIQAQLDNTFTFELHFTDGKGNNWEDSVNQEIKTALDNLNMNYEIDTFEKGGLQLNIEGQGIDGIIESYAKVKAIQDEVAANTQNPAALSENTLWRELGDYLKLIEDEYGNVIDLQKELDSYLGKSTIRDIDKQFEGKIKSQDDYTELVETTLAKLREVGAYADKTDDEVRAIIDNYYTGIQKYQDFGSGVISTVQSAVKNAADNWDNSAVNELYNMLSEEAQAAFDQVELTAGMRIKFKTDPQAVAQEVEELSKLIDEQINNEANANKIGQNIDALENSKFKTGMSLAELRQFQMDSNISWGETIEGMEDPIIQFSEFLKMSDAERVSYLEKLQTDLSNAQIQNLESTKQTLEDLQKYTNDVLIPEAEKAAQESRMKYNGMQQAQQYSGGQAYSQEEMDAARAQMAEDDLAVQQLYADVEKYGEEVVQVAEEIEINAEYAAQKVSDAWKSLDSKNFNIGDTITAEEISLLKSVGIDLDQFSREVGDGTREIYQDADKLSEAIHLSRQQILLENSQQEVGKPLSIFHGLSSQKEADDFDKNIEKLKAAGVDVSSFYNELSSHAGIWDTQSEAYKNYVEAVKQYNKEYVNDVKQSNAENKQEFLNGIESFKELKYWVEQGAIDVNSEDFEQVQTYLEGIGTWVNEITNADDFIEKILPGEDGIVELDNVVEDYDLIKSKITELTPDQFLQIGNAIKDDTEKAQWFEDNLGKVKISADNLSQETAEQLKEKLGEDLWNQLIEGVDLSKASLEELNIYFNSGVIDAEKYADAAIALLSNEDMSTEDRIKALNNLILEGADAGKVYSEIVKEILGDQTKTSQEKMREINQQITGSNGQKEYINSAEDRFNANSTFSSDNTLSDQDRIDALKQESIALEEIAAKGEATDMMWRKYGEDTAAVYGDIKAAAEAALPEILKAFDPTGEAGISKDNYIVLGQAISSVFENLQGTAEEKANILQNLLGEYDLTLESLGLELSDFYEKEKEAFSINENLTVVENVQKLNEQLQQTGDIDGYAEALKELLSGELDWTITQEAATAHLYDFSIALAKTKGNLNEVAGQLGKSVSSMEDYQSLMAELSEDTADVNAKERAQREALSTLGKQYDSCSTALRKYEQALRSNKKALIEAAEASLKLSIRSAEIAEKFNLSEESIQTLAESYRELSRTVDENGNIIEVNEEVATDMAARYLNLNNGIADLQKNWESYSEVLTNLQTAISSGNFDDLASVYADQGSELEGLRNAMAEVLDLTDATAISDQFLAENADLVEQAMNGDATAVEQLQLKLAEGLQAELMIDDEQFKRAVEEVGLNCENMADWLQSIPPGVITGDNLQFLQSLVDSMVEAGYAQEDIESKLRGMGIDVDLEPLEESLYQAEKEVEDAKNVLKENFNEMGDSATQMAFDAEMSEDKTLAEDQQEAVSFYGNPKPITSTGYMPTFTTMDVMGFQWPILSGSTPVTAEYPGVEMEPDIVTQPSKKENTSVALKVQSANKTAGGNISHRNSTGGNKPASRSTTPRSRSGSPRQSAPRTGEVRVPDVSSYISREIYDKKTHDEKYVEPERLEDYKKDPIQKELPNLKEALDEVYTTRKKFYNERYEKDRKVDEKEYVTKDSSMFKRTSEEIEQYHDINNILDKIGYKLDEINQRKSRAFGKAHIDAINEEKKALEEQLEAQNQYLNEMGARRKELQDQMKAQGWEFDENGSILNYVSKKTADVAEYNAGAEQFVEQANLNRAKWNEDAHKITDTYNQMNRDAVDVYNSAMNTLTNDTNNKYAKLDQAKNAAQATMVEAYNNALTGAAANKYNAEIAANAQYEARMQNAIDKKNAADEEAVKDRDTALTEAEINREKALDTAISNREEALSRAYSIYQTATAGLEGTYEESTAKYYQKIADDAKTAYDEACKKAEDEYKNATSEAENVYSNTTKKIENDYNNITKKADATFKNAKTDAEAELKRKNTEAAQEYKQAQQNATHEYEVAKQEADRIYEQGKRLIDEGYDDQSHEIKNNLEDMKDLATDFYDDSIKQIDEVFESAEHLNDLAKENYEFAYNESENLRSEYESLEDTMAQAMLDAQELRNKIYDNALEVIDYTLNLKVQLSNEVMTALTALLDSLGDAADKATDRIATLGQQMYQFTYQTKANRDAIYDLLNSQKEVDSNTMNRFMNGSFTQDDLNKLFNLDEFTSDKIANLEAYRDNLVSLISEQRNLKESMFEVVSGAFSEYQTSLSLQIDKIINLTKITQTYKNIVNIVGKKVLDASGELSDTLAKAAFETQRDQTHTYKSILDEIDSNIADMKQKQAAYDEDSEMFKDFQKRIDDMEAERRSAQDNWLSSWEAEMQAAADYYANAIDTITRHFDESISGLIGSLDLLNKEYERQKKIEDIYVEDYEKIYQLSKLTRDIEEAIDNSDHVKNKQKLKKLQDEINQASKDGVKLSQYDLDVLRKKFELELARDELEESRNAKSQVRMMRDAEGNYGYVYTADANAVADAEQKYEDKLHELQVLNTDYIKQLEDNYLELQQNVRDEIASLDITQFATEEEYLAEVERIQTAALELQERMSQQMGNALGNNRDLYENEWTAYSQMTGYKISADEDYLDKFNETTYSVLTGFQSMNEAKDQFTASLAEAILGAIEAYRTTAAMQEIAMQDGGTTMADFAQDAIQSTEQVVEETQALATEAETLSETYQDAFGQIADSAAEFADNYVKNIQPVIDSNLQLLDTIAKIIEHQANLNGTSGDGSGSGGITSGVKSNGAIWDAFGTVGESIGAKTKIASYLPWVAAVAKYADPTTDSGGWGTGDTRRTRLNEVFGVGAADDFEKYWNEYAATGGLFEYFDVNNWQKFSYDSMKKMKFDTGGYTGNWNSIEGRLALLHEKELVLNQQDTDNILQAVDMVRKITQMIDLNALSAESFLGSMLTAANVSTANNEVLQQEVHITAEFPNATDRDEIIAAFDNLTNLAMQYAGKQNYV